MASCDKGISERNFSSIKTKVYMEQSPINIKSNARVFSNDPFTAMTLYSAVKSTKEQVANPTPGLMQLSNPVRKWLPDQLQQGRHTVTTNRIRGQV